MGFEFARYLKVRGAWGASWSPDALRVSFLTEITGVPQVWAVSAAGGWPEQLTFHEERVSGAEYSPIQDRLLFGMDAGGNERSQLFLLEAGEVTDLTRAPDAIHYSGGFSPDGGGGGPRRRAATGRTSTCSCKGWTRRTSPSRSGNRVATTPSSAGVLTGRT